MRNPVMHVAALAAVLFTAGCAHVPHPGAVAEARMQPTKGHDVRGSVQFRQAGNAVEVVASLSGLAPGLHGFHVHEKGDCSAADGTSARGHFNPAGKPHGHPGHGHAGDLPMLQADAQGRAQLQAMVPGLRVEPGASGIVGRAVIVHAAPDDFQTQPTGNSGARVACGVIAPR